MSRVLWMVVGAAGGILAYRRGVQAVERARELGPIGTAQVVAEATSRAATGAAAGLGRLHEVQQRRRGRLVIGTAEDVGTPTVAAGHRTAGVDGAPIPAGWVPVKQAGRP